MSGSNTQITDRALAVLRREMASIKTRAGEKVALVYVSEYVDPIRKTLAGFRPGYWVAAWRTDNMHNWRIARLSDGTELPFFPVFTADDDTHYSIDVSSEAFGTLTIAAV